MTMNEIAKNAMNQIVVLIHAGQNNHDLFRRYDRILRRWPNAYSS